jgi:CRP/FNR family transcriptional regulator
MSGFLRRVPIFKGLSAKDLKALSRVLDRREAAKGEIIFAKGSPGDTFFIVAEGVVKIFSTSPVGKVKTFAYLGPGDFFGEMALLVADARSASAMAVGPVTLFFIRRQDFQKLFRQGSRLAFTLLMALCERLRWADREIESLSFNSVLGRLARILLDLSARYGRPGAGGTRIELDVSHQELADMTGTAREMVTRLLNRFARLDCLDLSGKRIVVTAPEKLREWIA